MNCTGRGILTIRTDSLSEVMEQLVQEKSGYTIRPEQALNFTKRIPRDLSKLAPVYYCGAFLAYWLIFGKKTRAAVLSLLGETVLLWAVYFYLYCQGRYMVNRVDVGLWFSVCLVVLWLISDSGNRKPYMAVIAGRTAPVLFFAVLIASQLLWSGDWRINTSSIPEARVSQRAVLETIGTDKDHVYLAKSAWSQRLSAMVPSTGCRRTFWIIFTGLADGNAALRVLWTRCGNTGSKIRTGI